MYARILVTIMFSVCNAAVIFDAPAHYLKLHGNIHFHSMARMDANLFKI